MSNAVYDLRDELQIYLVLMIDLQTRLCYRQPMTDIAIKVLEQTKLVDALCDKALSELATVHMPLDVVVEIRTQYVQLSTTKDDFAAWKVRKLSAWRRLHMLGSHKQVSRWGRSKGHSPSSGVPLRTMVKTAVSGSLK